MRRCVHELTVHDEEGTKIYSCNTLQPCTIQLEGYVCPKVQTVSESQALEVRAATDEIGVCGVDGHLADIREIGAFAFESRRYGTPVTDTQ